MSFTEIWNKLILETNLFNFIVMVVILAIVFVKMDLKAMLTSMQNKIADNIKEVEQNKAESEQVLSNAKKSVENLQQDIDKINSDANESAKAIAAKILEDAKLQVEHISQNADRVILAEEKQLSANLINEISKISLEKSKNNIEKMLENNIEMHEKYINDSIEKIDGLTL